MRGRIKDTINPDKYKSIIAGVCEYFQITQADVMSRSKKREIIIARQLAQYFCYKLCFMTKYRVGQIFGRDHASVIHSIKTVNALRLCESKYRADYYELEALLNS